MHFRGTLPPPSSPRRELKAGFKGLTQSLYNDWQVGVVGAWEYETLENTSSLHICLGACSSIVFIFCLSLCLPYHWATEKPGRLTERCRTYAKLLTISIGAITYCLLTQNRVQRIISDVARRRECSNQGLSYASEHTR